MKSECTKKQEIVFLLNCYEKTRPNEQRLLVIKISHAVAIKRSSKLWSS